MIWFFALLAVVLFLACVLVPPLLGPRVPWQPVSTSKAVVLLQGQREQVLRKLKDLESEREAGSIEEPEYAELRSTLLTEAALLGRRIEAMQDTHADTPTEESSS